MSGTCSERPTVVKVSHEVFEDFLRAQPWSRWGVDIDIFQSLPAHMPATLEKLMRVIKSHYLFSYIYIFDPTIILQQSTHVDWSAIPVAAAAQLQGYIGDRHIMGGVLWFACTLNDAMSGNYATLLAFGAVDEQ
jgi:hypothetical protein